ncbi:hypothetical protein KY290_007641 [Solanum tuberosum]|uniref:Uncharacterized protein n=1 Tax=Solanum tuberosum TaxID=4113 RepID=A0ABQ7W662_SOLTU|nr:hypothetical protein KY290_007641 [Solanum tuberosum]
MTNSSTSSKTPIPQEFESPSSFNFSTPLAEQSPSTPVCGVGEIGESITPLTEVVVSPALPSGEIFPYSPTLVMSCDKSQNSEAQSVIKPSVDPPTEEVEVLSRGVFSTMSERLFDGDLPEGKGPESNILATGAKLVVVQSLASLRGDVQPTLLEQKLRSPEQVPHSVQPMFDQTPRSFDVENDNKKGVRGANILKVDVPDLETVKSAPEAVLTHEPTEFVKERKRKRKGKMVESHSKGDKKRYGTRSEMQKVIGSAIAANVILTERARKRR